MIPVYGGIFVCSMYTLVGFVETRSVRCPRTGVTIGSELQLLCVSAGHWTWILYKNRMYS